MALNGRKIAIAIPDTVLEEHDALREKTQKLGIIARAGAIFGVDSIQIFRDPRGRGESKLIKKILDYLETPQYLRRRIFGFEESLRYAGLLPPLRIPSHKSKVPLDKLSVGDVREGVVLSDGRVDIGLDSYLRLNQKTGADRRVTVKITRVSPLMGGIVEKSSVSQYWGYTVEVKTLEETLKDNRFDLKIATSRYGNNLNSLTSELRQSMANARGVMLIFGSPSRGLFDIVGKDLTKSVNYVVNLFSEQHVETVRTEEAISAALYLTNLFLM
ncbi:MAG: methylase [Thaumarchaeota archaeon]|nr:methylase [Nitrososphaerota archaeon]